MNFLGRGCNYGVKVYLNYNIRLNTETSQVVQTIQTHCGPEINFFTSLSFLKLLSADATVAVAVKNIRIQTLRLGNILSTRYSAKTFNACNAPNCFLANINLWTIAMWFISSRRSSLLMSLEHTYANLATLSFNYSFDILWKFQRMLNVSEICFVALIRTVSSPLTLSNSTQNMSFGSMLPQGIYLLRSLDSHFHLFLICQW